ncbi:MAG: AbgT family transporter [Planctomycetota bacterium]|nr:AbgT family transporter [Planctomycetota bacterium]
MPSVFSVDVDTSSRSFFLDFIERVGNRLPDPITLFALGTLMVMIASQLAVTLDWQVTPVQPVVVGSNDQGPIIDWQPLPDKEAAQSLFSSDGLFWAISNLVKNFIEFPPLGVVLVGMLGIGVAELTGLIGALLKLFMMLVPRWLLTPSVVFIGIMSSMALDAGYIVLPPLAAALYQAAGRSPLAGIAASFAGVSAGFNANLLVTGLDPLLAGFSSEGARVIQSDYEVAATCNWWFMIVSTVTMTLTGWATTAWFVERRLADRPADEAGVLAADQLSVQRLTAEEVGGLQWALAAMVVVGAALGCLILIEGAPLYGIGARFPRWVESIVPMIFIGFFVPGLAFGIRTGNITSDKSASQLLNKSIATMAPIIVLSFFAAQFISCFRYSNLDRMLALSGGQALARAEMPPILLILVFILLTAVFNLFVGSMSAKYAMFAPVFVPMLMMVGISPELTQAAYRIGDSITNIITPLNAYLVIVLVFVQRYAPQAGMGTLISAMMPYTFAFGVVWMVQIVIWMLAGWPLGVEGPLHYPPGG